MTRKSPSVASSPSSTMEGGPGTGRFVCSMCSKVYRSGAGLRYHKRKRHRVGEGVIEPTALHRVKCQEPGCAYQMLAISDLRNHLSNHHQKPEYKCTEEKKFTSLADFTDWKSSFEARTESKYVKNCGAKGKSDNQTTEYYYCNRTGPFGQGLRRNKIQGSLRCGIHCTSSMKVEIQNDEHITVQYYPAHYGHNNIFNSEDSHLSENSTTVGVGGGGVNGNSSSTHLNGHQQQENSHYSMNAGDRSSSSSPGSSSTSPSGGSNSNSNHPPILSSLIDRPSMSLTNSSAKTFIAPSNHQNFLQNQMSHCIIISPSFVDVEHPSLSHSNHQPTPVLVVHQSQLPNPQILSSSTTTAAAAAAALVTSTTPNLPVKKEKSVSDIMRESFNILSYWPLDHHHGLITSENESQISHPQVNMDEHLMF